MKPVIRTKRVYDKPSKDDGIRVLVDRLWPRGMKKEELEMREWIKDLSPSPDLRTWFNHDPERWPEFQKRYKAELKANEAVAGFVEKYEEAKVITLLYAAKDEQHNHALVLQEYLEHRYRP
ncbi:MAG TPA: DUF488 family protein [Puia sp.]|jgi:uncharacterized protein YeaO (DUF488 family)